MERHLDERTDEMPVTIPVGEVTLEGDLRLPPGADAVVAFAHGSGSGRHSSRNRMVAGSLSQAGMATLLLDLLTREEEVEDMRTGHLRFDIGLLTDRLVATVDWLERNAPTRELAVGLFGASTGAAGALMAAAARPQRVEAVVSRGGRPDLAGAALGEVVAPTLLIVGGDDTPVIGMNRDAMQAMTCHRELEVVPGASHLFEEPGALEQVAELAREWFQAHLGVRPATPG
jgi:putative phosphoribosyl transferase